MTRWIFPGKFAHKMIRIGATAARILVIDDLAANITLLRRLLSTAGFETLGAADFDEGLRMLEREHPDAILMDIRMPRHDGFTSCRELKRNPQTRLIPVVLMTASSERSDRLQAIDAGADDFVTKPLNVEELTARLRSLVRVKRYTDDLEDAEQVILSLALTIEARDACTDGHCQRLASYASALGREIGLGEDDLRALHRGGYLHDVGKIGIPDAVLLKAGALTRAEFTTIRTHPIIGERLCGALRSLSRVRPIVRHHHERLDGGGYPDALRGDAIPLLAQIVAIADVYDALTTSRPYRDAVPPTVACEELRREAARGWKRSDLVEAFVVMSNAGRLTGANLARQAAPSW